MPCAAAAHDVLEHDDGVVDDEAGGEHQREQRQDVDREAHHVDRGQRADQRHRDGQRRDQRRAPVAQEEVDDRRRRCTTESASVRSTSWIDAVDEDRVVAGDEDAARPRAASPASSATTARMPREISSVLLCGLADDADARARSRRSSAGSSCRCPARASPSATSESRVSSSSISAPKASGVLTVAVVRTTRLWFEAVERPRRAVEGDRRQRVAHVGERQPAARQRRSGRRRRGRCGRGRRRSARRRRRAPRSAGRRRVFSTRSVRSSIDMRRGGHADAASPARRWRRP